MGTRSTVKFYSEFKYDEPVMCVYQQFDGYIDGKGHELANFLKGKTVINGISTQTMEEGFANGMECLAAQFVAKKKTTIGGFYLTTNDNSQDYDYEVRLVDGQLIIKVNDFEGSPDELLAFKEE